MLLGRSALCMAFAVASVSSIPNPETQGCPKFHDGHQDEQPQQEFVVNGTTETVPYYSEHKSHDKPCFKHVCYPTTYFPFYSWSMRLNRDKCCIHGDNHIEIGKSVVMEEEEGDDGAAPPPPPPREPNPCAEKVMRCQLPELPHNPPETVLEVLPNSKCCHHEGQVLRTGETVVDAARCALLSCQKPIGGPFRSLQATENVLTVTHVYENSCGCCSHNGTLVRDGDFLAEENAEGTRPSNVSCIKGELFRVTKFSSSDEIEEYDGDETEPDGNNVTSSHEFELDAIWPHFGVVFEFVRSAVEANDIDRVAYLVEQGAGGGGIVDQFARLMSLALPLPANATAYPIMFSSLRVGCSFAYSLDSVQGRTTENCGLLASLLKQLPLEKGPEEETAAGSRAKAIGAAVKMAKQNAQHHEGSGVLNKTMILLFTGAPDDRLPFEQVGNLSHVVAINLGEAEIRFRAVTSSLSLEGSSKVAYDGLEDTTSLLAEAMCNGSIVAAAEERFLDSGTCTATIGRFEGSYTTTSKECSAILGDATVCSSNATEPKKPSCRREECGENPVFVHADRLSRAIDEKGLKNVAFLLDQNSPTLATFAQALLLSLDSKRPTRGFVTFYSYEVGVRTRTMCFYGYSFLGLQGQPLGCDFVRNWFGLPSKRTPSAWNEWRTVSVREALQVAKDNLNGTGEDTPADTIMVILTENLGNEGAAALEKLPLSAIRKTMGMGYSMTIFDVTDNVVKTLPSPVKKDEKAVAHMDDVVAAYDCVARCKCNESSADIAQRQEEASHASIAGQGCVIYGRRTFTVLGNQSQKGSLGCFDVLKANGPCSRKLKPV